MVKCPAVVHRGCARPQDALRRKGGPSMIRYRHPGTTGRRPVVRVALVMLALPLVALAPVGVAGASADTTAAAAAAPVVVPARHRNIQYLGRWGRLAEAMTTVNSGSHVILRFTGRHVAATFDQSTVTHPPQIYARLDRGASTLYTVDRNQLDLTPRGLAGGGVHTLEIAVKDVDER